MGLSMGLSTGLQMSSLRVSSQGRRGSMGRAGTPGAGLHQLRAPASQPGHNATPTWHCCSHVCSKPGLWGQGLLDHALLHVQTCPESAKG